MKKLIILLMLFLAYPIQHAHSQIQWGATYFSAWNDSNIQVVNMNHPEWFNRSPFFGELQSTIPMQERIHSFSQEIIDQEIELASYYGLDYFAFYSTTQFMPERDLYRKSSKKSKLKFCMTQGWFGGANAYFNSQSKKDEIDYLVALFKDSQYEKVLGGRPLFFWYAPGGTTGRDPVGVFGSNVLAKAFFDSLRVKSQNAGAGNPYVVVLNGWYATANDYKTVIGGDAISTYAVGQLNYPATMNDATNFWNNSKSIGAQLVPPMDCGWGGPHVKHWGGVGPFDDAGLAEMYQWKKQLTDAKNFINTNPTICTSQAALIYAWSEYGEGGWLNADRVNGPDKLEILHQVKNNLPGTIRWDFSYRSDEWTSLNIANLQLTDNKLFNGKRYLTGSYSGDDPQITSIDNLNIDLTGIKYMVVSLKNNSALTNSRIYFQTTASATFAGNSVPFTAVANDTAYREYYIDMTADADWKGTLKQIRVDPVDFRTPPTTPAGTSGIDYIRLETDTIVPEKVFSPYPANNKTNESRYVDISWINSIGTTVSDIYFGTTNPPAFKGTQTNTTFELPHLSANTKYYWRIDSRCGRRVKTGDVWQFTTGVGDVNPPQMPVNLNTNAVSYKQINLTWSDKSDCEEGTIIYRQKKGIDGNFKSVDTVDANISSYSDTSLVASTIYNYYVVAYNSKGISTRSKASVDTTLAMNVVLTPSTPNALVATAVKSSQINLKWNDNSSNETGFVIERKTETESYKPIDTTNSNVSSFSDMGLKAETIYYYRVYAINKNGNSGFSNETFDTTLKVTVVVLIPPSAPSNLSAVATGTTEINLSWNDNSNNETGFIVERKTGSENYLLIDTMAANATTLIDIGLNASTIYFYRVYSFNKDGNSGYSNVGLDTTFSIQAKIQSSSEHDVLIYPNPAHDFVTVDIRANSYNRFIIYDLSGKIIDEKEITGNYYRFDVSLYPRGCYTISLLGKENIKTVKFIIE